MPTSACASCSYNVKFPTAKQGVMLRRLRIVVPADRQALLQWMRTTSRTLPQFASAALYHAAETSSTMRNYHQDWQTPAGIPETMLQRAYRKKIKKSDAAAAGTHSSPWCIPL
ncbi:uncharacterized protein LOC144330214 isoform X2 [Macaca mulatta]